MDFFVYDDAGNVVNCIVADDEQKARDVVARVYGPGADIVQRKQTTRAVDIGDTFDKAQRTFTKRADGRKIVDAVELGEVREN